MSDLNIFLIGLVVFMLAATGAFQYGLVLFRAEYQRQNSSEVRSAPATFSSQFRTPGSSAPEAGRDGEAR